MPLFKAYIQLFCLMKALRPDSFKDHWKFFNHFYCFVALINGGTIAIL